MNALHLRLSALLLAACAAAVPRTFADDHARPEAPEPPELSFQEYEILDRFMTIPDDCDAMMRLADIKARSRAVQVIGEAIHKANADPNLPQRQTQWAMGLESFRDSAAPLLLELAHDKNTALRQFAIRVLGTAVEKPTPELLAVCRAGLEDPDVVQAALGVLGTHPDDEAGPKVFELMHTPAGKECPSPVADEALRMIRYTHYAPALPELCQLVGDDDIERRQIAAAGIAPCARDAGEDDRQRAVAALMRLVNDPNPQVAQSAAVGLAEMGNPAGIPVILFTLRAFVGNSPEQLDGLYDETEYVTAIQKCCGIDLHISTQEWKFDADTVHLPAKLETLRLQVESIAEKLNAAGIATSGYPHLPRTLSDPDKAMFDHAFATWLIDPAGAKWVECTYNIPNPYGGVNAITTRAWHFTAEVGKPERVLLPDGAVISKWVDMHPVDLVEASKAFLDQVNKGYVPSPPALDAACLYRQGHEDLAAGYLYLARSRAQSGVHLENPNPDDALRLLVLAYAAFSNGDDEAARINTERFLKVYGPDAGNAKAAHELLDELGRRQKEGAHPPLTEPPADLATWPVEKQVVFLISELQEINSSESVFRGLDFSEDWRVKELVRLGDAAMPALLNCMEKDSRFMRVALQFPAMAMTTMHFGGEFQQPSPHLLRVRSAAFYAVVNILQTTVLDISVTNERQTQVPQSEEDWKAFAATARAYWDRYGNLRLDQRMLVILADPKVSPAAASDAAEVLACFGKQGRFWYGGFSRDGYDPGEPPNPLIARMQQPGLAELLLSVHDRIFKSLHDQGKADEAEDFADRFLQALPLLHDLAIVPELKRRFAHEADLRGRLRMAMLCQRMHDADPLKEFAAAFKAGNLRPGLDATDTAPCKLVTTDLSRIIQSLVQVNDPFVDEALNALADARHPYHAAAVETVMAAIHASWNGSSDGVLQHPYYIALVRPMLDDTSLTGGIYQVYHDACVLIDENQPTTLQGNHSYLRDDMSKYREATNARACDAVAIYLSTHLLGVPVYHPLRLDRDERLDLLKAYLNRFGDAMVPVDYRIYEGTNHYWGGGLLMPALPKVNGNPTAAQRATGKMVLDLPDALPVPLSLPAIARRRTASEEEPRVLIVQVARDWDGKTHYGILSEEGISAVTDDDITDIEEFQPE